MFNYKIDEKHLVRVKPIRECVWNIVGCLLVAPCFLAWLAWGVYPLTIDLLVAIFLAEYNRRVNQRRREAAKESLLLPPPTRSSTALAPLNDQRPQFPSVAAVVGYREDLAIFETALRSYESARGCVFVLVSVDGEDEKDLEMVSIFNKVCRSPPFLVQPDQTVLTGLTPGFPREIGGIACVRTYGRGSVTNISTKSCGEENAKSRTLVELLSKICHRLLLQPRATNAVESAGQHFQGFYREQTVSLPKAHAQEGHYVHIFHFFNGDL